MANLFDWMMGNSKFESLPPPIKDTAQWKRYQTDINTAEVQLVVAKERLNEIKKAAEGWADEQLEYAAETDKHNAAAEQGGGRRRKRRSTRKHRRKRKKKTRHRR